MNSQSNPLYFLTLFLMHSCVFVLLDPRVDDIEAGIDAALEPFSEDLEVEPYRIHLSHRDVRWMAEHYQVPPAGLHALAAKMPDWMSCEGGVDRDGLYYLATFNPDGRWDWFEIGGRWDGYIPRARNNVIKAGTLAGSPGLSRCLPCYVLTPDGKWLEHERFYPGDDWNDFKKEALGDDEWLRIVREALLRWPKHRVVCVDIHS